MDNCLQTFERNDDETRSVDFNDHVDRGLSGDVKPVEENEQCVTEAEKSKNSRSEKNFFGQSSGTETRMRDEDVSKIEPSCPICGSQVEEVSMNRHVDECLNAETLKNLRREQLEVVGGAPKRKIEPSSSSGNKRTKVVKDKSKSILNYFQPKNP